MTPEPQSTAGLVSDALQHLTNLARGEIALAKSEATDKVRRAARGLVMLALAAIFAGMCICFLAAGAMVALIDAGLTPLAAILAGAAALGLLALVAGLAAARWLYPSGLTPDRTIRNLRRDASTFKEMINDPAR